MKRKKYILIGIGGIGSHLIRPLAAYIMYSNKTMPDLVLVDGDTYEQKNLERQVFDRYDYKVMVQKDMMQKYHINITPISQYINEEEVIEGIPVQDVIDENSIVLLAVDNHKTRNIVLKYAEKLANITVISGGNDKIDGNVVVYMRKNGKDITTSPCSYHEELENPPDKHPEEVGCDEVLPDEPQTVFANLMAASIMLNTLYAIDHKKFDPEYSEVYFDILTNKVMPAYRAKEETHDNKTRS